MACAAEELIFQFYLLAIGFNSLMWLVAIVLDSMDL